MTPLVPRIPDSATALPLHEVQRGDVLYMPYRGSIRTRRALGDARVDDSTVHLYPRDSGTGKSGTLTLHGARLVFVTRHDAREAARPNRGRALYPCERDYTCPLCSASAGEQCHVRGKPDKPSMLPHVDRFHSL